MSAPIIKVGTKIGSRTSIPRKRYLQDNAVSPIWYHGSHQGHGNYMAGTCNGETVCDKTGKPVPFKQIGVLR